MTLSEMIKKYEKMKVEVIAESGSRPSGDIVMINAILKDLHSVARDIVMIDLIDLKDKILSNMCKALDSDDSSSVLDLATTLLMLPT